MAKMTKMGDDTLKVKDNGKRKVTVKTSTNVNDSVPSASYSRTVEKPKKGIFKSQSYSLNDSLNSKGTFYHNESNIQKKETPRKLYVSSTTETGKNRYDAMDSSYTQQVRKPTTRRAGYESTIVTKTKLGMPSSSASMDNFSKDMPSRKPISSTVTVKKLPKLAPKKKGS